MIKPKIYKYILINILINFTLLTFLFFIGTNYYEYKKQKVIDAVKSQIYEDISYNLALPDYVEVQRQINSAKRSEIIGIVVVDKFGKNIWSNGEKHKISNGDITQNLIYDGREVGVLGIALDNGFFKSNLKKIAIALCVGHIIVLVLSILVMAHVNAKKIKILEDEKALTERRLLIVGKLAACITRELKKPVMDIEKYIFKNNSKYISTVKKIQAYIDQIEQVAEDLPEDEVESINDYVNDTISACRRMDKMKRNVVPIPIYAGKHLSKTSKI